jgi:hypothetical protein
MGSREAKAASIKANRRMQHNLLAMMAILSGLVER